MHWLRSIRLHGLTLLAIALTLPGMIRAGDSLMGRAAPGFVLDALDAGRISLADLRGKRVVVHFWATWCGACIKEMPELDRAQREIVNPEIVVLAVNVGEDRKTVAKHAAERGYGFRVALDPDWKTAERYGIVALPATFFIDALGIVRERVNGGNLTREKLVELVQRMGAGPPPS